MSVVACIQFGHNKLVRAHKYMHHCIDSQKAYKGSQSKVKYYPRPAHREHGAYLPFFTPLLFFTHTIHFS